MSGIGFDAGTYNLICAKRDENGNFTHNREVNAFLELELENKFVFNMMKKNNVPLIEREDANVAYVLGESAMKMAYTMKNLEIKRPMKDGCVNPKERDAFQIMSLAIHSLVGEIERDREVLLFSVPANAINQETDADYHSKILQSIFDAYESEKGYKLDARPINEGMCLVYSAFEDKMFTGIGVSCGAGMVNVAFGLYGAEVFSFALVNSGDWIDRQAARATSESIAFINKEKQKIDLSKEPETLVERAIKTQYELMIEKTVAGIKRGLEENEEKNARLDEPVNIVVAGGTSSPPGFDVLFEKYIREIELPIEIGSVVRPEKPLFGVAQGALIAAENSSDD